MNELGEAGVTARSQTNAIRVNQSNPLVPLKELVRQGRLAPEQFRKAFVRTLLTEALGESLSDSLEFQSVSDQILQTLEASEAGRDLLARALAEIK